ncbi:MAG: hypothetical protein K6E98_00340 [Lachnospiraceae bacterium]|nr:hypothetical protein [Lachnospiraceae bacterium]
MKKARLKDIFVNILKKRVSFLSIVTIMFLGVSGIPGLYYMGVSIDRSITRFYDSHNFKDFEIMSNMGITKEDIEKIKIQGGVAGVEGVYGGSAYLVVNDKTYNINIVSQTQNVSVPFIKTGRFGEGSSECVLSSKLMSETGLSEGDVVKLKFREDKLKDLLKCEEFTVTGSAEHPDYINRSSSNFAVLPLEAFETSTLNEAFTSALIKMNTDGLSNVFSDEYLKKSENIQVQLNELAGVLSGERDAEISSEAEKKYNDAKAEADKGLNDARDTLNEAENKRDKELSDAYDKLKDGESELNSQLRDGQSQLESGHEQASDQMAKALNELREGEKKYSEGVDELAKGQYQYDEGLAQIEKAKVQLEDAKTLLDTGRETYNTLINEMEKAINESLDLMSPYHDIFDDLINRTDAEIKRLEKLKNFSVTIYEDIVETETGEYISELIEEDDEARKAANEAKQNAEYILSIIDMTRWNEFKKDYYALDSGWSRYNAGAKEANNKLKEARSEYGSKSLEGSSELLDAWKAYYDGKESSAAKLLEGKSELSANELRVYDGLNEAQKQLDELDKCNYTVTNRSINSGYIMAKPYHDSIFSLIYFFAPLFAIVASVVCFSTMIIIVEEHIGHRFPEKQ